VAWPHGGGASSARIVEVDRSAAYAARWVAKNVVGRQVGVSLRGAGCLRDRESRGQWSVMVETFGTEAIPHERIEQLVGEHFDLRRPRSGSGSRCTADLPEDAGVRPLRSRRRRTSAGSRTDMADALRKGRRTGRHQRDPVPA